MLSYLISPQMFLVIVNVESGIDCCIDNIDTLQHENVQKVKNETFATELVDSVNVALIYTRVKGVYFGTVFMEVM